MKLGNNKICQKSCCALSGRLPALLHPRPSILPAARDQQHTSASSLLISSEGSVSQPSLSPILAQFPAPSEEIKFKAMLCVLLQHCSNSQKNKPYSQLIPKRSAEIFALCCHREAWFILQLCSQPQESCRSRTQEFIFLACDFVTPVHKRGCNAAAVNPACGLHQDGTRGISHLSVCLGSSRVIIHLQGNLTCFKSAQV